MLAMRTTCMLCDTKERTPYISAVHQLVSPALIYLGWRDFETTLKRLCPDCLLNAPAAACIDANSCSLYDLQLEHIAHLPA